MAKNKNGHQKIFPDKLNFILPGSTTPGFQTRLTPLMLALPSGYISYALCA